MTTLEHAPTAGPGRRPPPLPRSVRARPLLWAAAGGLAVVAAVWLAGSIAAGALPYPVCGFKAWTGLPCPGCGGTRSLSALGALELARALAWNPLIASAALVGIAALPIAAWDAAANRRRLFAACGRVMSSRVGPWLIVAALLANWIYLLVARTP